MHGAGFQAIDVARFPFRKAVSFMFSDRFVAKIAGSIEDLVCCVNFLNILNFFQRRGCHSINFLKVPQSIRIYQPAVALSRVDFVKAQFTEFACMHGKQPGFEPKTPLFFSIIGFL